MSLPLLADQIYMQVKGRAMNDLFIFKFTLKHDAGRVALQVYARDIADAVKQVLTVEKAPERAILKIERK